MNYLDISVPISSPCNSDPEQAVHVQLQLVADPLQEQDQVLVRRGFACKCLSPTKLEPRKWAGPQYRQSCWQHILTGSQVPGSEIWRNGFICCRQLRIY